MTLILDLDLDVMKLYLRARNEVRRSRHSKVEPEQDTVFRSCDFDLDPMTLIYEIA